jgi:hypothetical protein
MLPRRWWFKISCQNIGGSGDAEACYLIQFAAETGAIVLNMRTIYVYASAERNTEQIVIRRSSRRERVVF